MYIYIYRYRYMHTIYSIDTYRFYACEFVYTTYMVPRLLASPGKAGWYLSRGKPGDTTGDTGCDTVPGMKSYMTGMERSEKNIWKIWGMGRVLLIWGALAAKLWLSDLLIGFGTVSETVRFILPSMKGGDLSLRTYVGSNKIIQQHHDPTQKKHVKQTTRFSSASCGCPPHHLSSASPLIQLAGHKFIPEMDKRSTPVTHALVIFYLCRPKVSDFTIGILADALTLQLPHAVVGKVGNCRLR